MLVSIGACVCSGGGWVLEGGGAVRKLCEEQELGQHDKL